MFVLQSCCGEGGGSEKWYIMGEERRTAFSKSKVPLWQKFNFSATEIYRNTYIVYDESLYLTTQPFMMRKATYGLHLSNDQMWKGLSLFRGCINDAVAVFIHVRYLPLAELWWLPPPVMATEISSPLLPSSHVGQAAFWSSKTGVVHWNWCPPRLGLYCICPRHTRHRIKCWQW